MSEYKAATQWAAMLGHWTFAEGKAVYSGPSEGLQPMGVCVTNVLLSAGEVSCRVRMEKPTVEPTDEGRLILGFRSFDERFVVAGVGGWRSAYSVGEWLPGLGLRPVARAGDFQNLIPDKWYTQKVEIKGQRLTISVEDVPVLQHVLTTPIVRGQVGLFSWGWEKLNSILCKRMRIEVRHL